MLVLETSRLFIRPLAISDFEDVHRLHTDHLVVQSLFSGEPPSCENTQEKMKQYVRDWRQNGFGFFGVFLKDSKEPGEFAGRAGLRYFEDTTHVEYGLCLFGHVAGRGIGPEVGRVILRFSFKELNLERVVAVVRPENKRSIRALGKIGFKHVEDREYGDHVKGFYEVRATQYGIARQSGGTRAHTD
ncbi:GNAT family N-acetyltransferase [Mesorhizobium amorphae]|uniref:GNAT family N-acetyltransferase n=1 Tax=Mesorhizobium amorphae TaxID=71433 RepID=UPI00177EC38A